MQDNPYAPPLWNPNAAWDEPDGSPASLSAGR